MRRAFLGQTRWAGHLTPTPEPAAGDRRLMRRRAPCATSSSEAPARSGGRGQKQTTTQTSRSCRPIRSGLEARSSSLTTPSRPFINCYQKLKEPPGNAVQLPNLAGCHCLNGKSVCGTATHFLEMISFVFLLLFEHTHVWDG